MENFAFYAVEIIVFFATFLKIILHAFSTWEKNMLNKRQTLALIKFFFAGCQKTGNTAQKMKFSIKNFFSKYDQTRSFSGFGHSNCRNPKWKTSFLCSE